MLGHDTRIKALRLTLEHPRTTQELAALLSMSEAGISRHPRRMVELGLMTRRRDGLYVLYCAEPDRVRSLVRALGEFLGETD